MNEESGAAEDPVQSELREVVLADESVLGEVYRRTESGESPEEIRVALGNERKTFVWNYLRSARAIVEGDLPTAPSVSLTAARRIRRVIRENELSPEAQTALDDRLRVLAERASDPTARAAEEKRALEASAEAEEHAVPGVYVYSLPHYLRHRYEEDSGRTLMKVGRADRSVIKRFREQIRTTALPEDPVLLRVYVTEEDDSTDKERTFHRLLEAADHDRSTARTGGTEWFLTSVRFLDEVAQTVGLEIREVGDLGDYD